MELFIRSTFAVIQAFAGNPGNFLGRTLEWPWYGLWVQAFYGVVDPRKVVAGPQFELAKMQNTNDGGVVFKKKVPDFVLHYVTGVPLYHDIDSLLRVTNHEELLQFYEGRCALTSSIVLAVCEVKALPDPTKIPAGDQFQAVLKKRLFNIQGEARSGARKQVSLHLSAHRDLDEVVAIAIFGPYFSWRILAWDAVSDISSNDDPTYHASESDGGDSSGDQAPRGPSVHQDQEIPDFLAAADRPAGRPKRGPHPVKEYVQYSILKAERLSTSEDDDTKKHPAQKLKGKAKALGTSVMEPEEKAILDGERADDEKADDAKEGGKKAGGKKAGGKKEGGKKAGGKKADDKKADGKKTDGKKTDGKKTDGKKTDGKKTDGKKADGKMEENKEENKKNKGKGKAREREKEEVKAAEDKKEKAEAPPEPEVQRLELPPFVNWEDPYQGILAPGGSHAGNSRAPTSRVGPEAASTSASASRAAGPSDRQNVHSDGEDEEDAHLPAGEHEWSMWYHWEHPNGIKQRSRMLDAIQRQNPDITFRFPN